MLSYTVINRFWELTPHLWRVEYAYLHINLSIDLFVRITAEY